MVGLPYLRETLSPQWNDPTFQVNLGGQPTGLNPLSWGNAGEVFNGAVDGTGNSRLLLPGMNSNWRVTPQLYSDNSGDPTFNGGTPNNLFSSNAGQLAGQLTQLWSSASWEDELIMTNVRSFDVKAYDNSYAGLR